MSNILLVEDSPEMQALVQSSLHDVGQTTTVATYENALQMLKNKSFDLVVIDVQLPDGNGYDLCSEIRKSSEMQRTPVVFLTGKDASSDKIRGYDLGADDYITKPFDPLEFRARIQSRMQRFRSMNEGRDSMKSGVVTFDTSMQRVFIGPDQKEIHLTPVEFRLLYYLAKREGQIVSRDELLRGIWQGNVNVVTQNVYTHISVIRKKLEMYANCIESIPNVCYCYHRVESAQV